jgi:hypothetical protein
MMKKLNRIEGVLRRRWDVKIRGKKSEAIRRQIKEFWIQVVSVRHDLRAALDGRLVSASAWEGSDEEKALENFGKHLAPAQQEKMLDKAMAKSEELLGRYEGWRKHHDSSLLVAPHVKTGGEVSWKGAREFPFTDLTPSANSGLPVMIGPDPVQLNQQLGWLIEELHEKKKLAAERYERELKKSPSAGIRPHSRRPAHIISFFDIIRPRAQGVKKVTVRSLSIEDYLNEISWSLDELNRWRENPSTTFPIDLLVWVGECLGAFHERTRSGRPATSDLIRYNRRVIALIYQADYENEQAKLDNKKKAPWVLNKVCREVFKLTKRFRDEFPGKAELKNGPNSDSIVKPVKQALEDAGIVLPKDDRARGRRPEKY